MIYLSASELAERIRSRELSSREVVDAHIDRIERVDKRINAVVMRRFDEARREADAADEAIRRGETVGPLHGVPVTIKDQFLVKGMPMTCGLSRLKDNVSDCNGQVVGSWVSAGAIVLGKTNVPQTMCALETDNALFGRTNNPWNGERTPGGSSGGEAAIVAAGGSAMGLGGDYGGSLRAPASWCGLSTLKPTARRLSTDPLPVTTAAGFEGLVAQPGPIARCVDDVTLGFRVMVEDNQQNPNGIFPPVPFRNPRDVDVSQLKIAYLPQIGDWMPSPAIRRGLALAADALRNLGATVEEWSPSGLQQASEMFFRLVSSDGFSVAKHLLGGEKPVSLMKPNVQLASMPSIMVKGLTKLLRASGQQHLAAITGNAKRLSATQLMDLLFERLKLERSFTGDLSAAGFDAVVCPALPLVAPFHNATLDLADFSGSLHLFNVLGLPAGVTPVTSVQPAEESDRGKSKDKAEQAAARSEVGSAGLPVPVQIVAHHWREDIVLAVMSAIEGQLSTNTDYPDPSTLQL